VKLLRCGIVSSRLFNKKYLFLIFGVDIVAFSLGFLTHFKFEGLTIGIGIVIILMGTYLIGREDSSELEMTEKSFDIIKNGRATTYSYNSIMGIIKDMSDKKIDFRYRMITTDSQYLLDTDQKDLPESVINRIGFWVYDKNYGKDLVCWKRLVTDTVVYKKGFIEALTWTDRLYFKQFQTAFFAALTILIYFLLTMVKFLIQ